MCWLIGSPGTYRSPADVIVTGKILGRQALGAYGLAVSLANAPTEKITALLGSVTSSVFSAVQTEQAALRRYLLSLTEGLSLLTFPATWEMAFVAHDFVLAVLGEKWRCHHRPTPAPGDQRRDPIRRASHPPVLFVTGEARFVMRNSLRAAVLLRLHSMSGSRWHGPGSPLRGSLYTPSWLRRCIGACSRKLDLPATNYLRALWPAVAGVALMGLAIWSLDQTLPHDWPLALRASVQIVAGAIVYLIALLAMRRDRLRGLYQTVKRVAAVGPCDGAGMPIPHVLSSRHPEKPIAIRRRLLLISFFSSCTGVWLAVNGKS